MSVRAEQTGGAGGNATQAGMSGLGAESHMLDAVSGATSGRLRLEQFALGGASTRGGAGGAASGSLDAQNAGGGDLDILLRVTGGNGGTSSSGPGGAGGAAQLGRVAGSSSTGREVSIAAEVSGGLGGNGGAGAAGGAGTSVSLFDRVEGETTGVLTLRQYASAGAAGNSFGGVVPLTGDALSHLGRKCECEFPERRYPSHGSVRGASERDERERGKRGERGRPIRREQRGRRRGCHRARARRKRWCGGRGRNGWCGRSGDGLRVRAKRRGRPCRARRLSLATDDAERRARGGRRIRSGRLARRRRLQRIRRRSAGEQQRRGLRLCYRRRGQRRRRGGRGVLLGQRRQRRWRSGRSRRRSHRRSAASCSSAAERGGRGGEARLGAVYGSSSGGGDVRVSGSAIGGSGGRGSFPSGRPGGDGASVELHNAVDGDTSGVLQLEQLAGGGRGRDGGAHGATSSVLEVAKSLTALEISALALGAFDSNAVASGDNAGGSVAVHSLATGRSGSSSEAATAGAGGSARARAFGTTAGDGHAVLVTNDVWNATGGDGGDADSAAGGAVGGRGGEADSESVGIALGDASVTVADAAAGGRGGRSAAAPAETVLGMAAPRGRAREPSAEERRGRGDVARPSRTRRILAELHRQHGAPGAGWRRTRERSRGRSRRGRVPCHGARSGCVRPLWSDLPESGWHRVGERHGIGASRGLARKQRRADSSSCH